MTQPDDDVLTPPFTPDADASNVDTTGLDDAQSRRARIAAQIAAITATPEEIP